MSDLNGPIGANLIAERLDNLSVRIDSDVNDLFRLLNSLSVLDGNISDITSTLANLSEVLNINISNLITILDSLNISNSFNRLADLNTRLNRNTSDLLALLTRLDLMNIDDLDGDSRNNGLDNCPFVANIEQADIDNNNIGDVCQDGDGDRIVFASDIDDDGDGLIEIWNINMLNNIRYNLEGTSYKTSTTDSGVETGCGGQDGITSCNGYELMRDLDFRNNRSYTDTSIKNSITTGTPGWETIGNVSTQFTGIFEGNRYIIRNLYIARNINNAEENNYIGFFGYIRNAEIRNTQLENISVIGTNYVGGLAGKAENSIIANSHSTGTVAYRISLNGNNEGIGGLVGYQLGGMITNSNVTGI